jgi:4-amino-4-deoxy-L-arabinose transferase-like glycosyltransferase
MKQLRRETLKTEYVFICVVLLLAFFLRSYNSGGLTAGDDSQYAQYAYHVLNDNRSFFYLHIPDLPISEGGFLEIRPFAVLPRVISTYLFGYTAFAIKFQSVFFATLAVLIFYLILRRQFSREITWTATLLLAINPFHITFTRIGINDGWLTFLILLTKLLVIKGIKEKKPWCFYVAGLLITMNLLTTDFRGVVPLVALIPLVFLMRPNKRLVKHILLAGLIGCVLWLLAFTLPLLWSDHAPWEHFVDRIHQATKTKETKTYFSFLESIKITGAYQYLTPFIGFIAVPALFGLLYTIKNIKKPKYALWVTWLLSSFAIYWQGQPHINRHAIIIPGIVILTSVGIWKTREQFISKNANKYLKLSFPLLIFLTITYILTLFKIFPMMFSEEWAAISTTLKTSILLKTYLLFDKLFFALIIMLLAVFLLWARKISKNRTTRRKKEMQSNYLIAAFLALNIILIFSLVITGVAGYHRPEDAEKISEYIKNNIGGEKYSCVAFIESKTLTYYTQRPCAQFGLVDLDWIKEKTNSGEVRYFVDNTQPVGVNQYLSEQSPLPKERFPDIYAWMQNNTKDITAKTGLDPRISTLKLYEYNKKQDI